MNCCHCEGVEIQFDRNKAAKKLARYRTKGAQKTTRILVEAMKQLDVRGKSLLDIGGGVGAIQHELLQAGAAGAVNLEASSGYMEACAEEAERLGHGDRITHLHGDFAEMPDAPEADLLTLERVICCYPDYEKLVERSCRKAREAIGIVIPSEALWVRISMAVIYNLKFVLQRNPFRVYLHPVKRIDHLIRSHGFSRRFTGSSGAWLVWVYSR